jgi:hypothetical protein
MTSLPYDEQENFFLFNEQPPINLQQSETFDGIKSIQRLLSNSSSILSTPQQPHRSLSSRDFTLPLHVSSLPSNDIDSFARQFERRLDEQRLLWQQEYNRKIQQINESKTKELNGLKVRYETKLQGLEDRNRQLEIHSGQINEENKRLKIENEHEKEKNRIEQVKKNINFYLKKFNFLFIQTSLEQHLKEFEGDIGRKIHETKLLHENEKQEIKRQHTRMYQDLLDETNQVNC